jgi:hypothetical protein
MISEEKQAFIRVRAIQNSLSKEISLVLKEINNLKDEENRTKTESHVKPAVGFTHRESSTHLL